MQVQVIFTLKNTMGSFSEVIELNEFTNEAARAVLTKELNDLGMSQEVNEIIVLIEQK